MKQERQKWLNYQTPFIHHVFMCFACPNLKTWENISADALDQLKTEVEIWLHLYFDHTDEELKKVGYKKNKIAEDMSVHMKELEKIQRRLVRKPNNTHLMSPEAAIE